MAGCLELYQRLSSDIADTGDTGGLWDSFGHNGCMNLKAPFDRITLEPDKMGGNPCIRGMRITIRRVLEILATYPDRAELFRDYPDLQEEDLQQALGFAAATGDVCG